MEKEEFVFFLKKKSAEITRTLSHYELLDIARDIKYECVTYFKMTWEEFNTGITRDLRLSEKILDRYRPKGSERSKNSVLDEFRKEYCYDIDRLITFLN